MKKTKKPNKRVKKCEGCGHRRSCEFVVTWDGFKAWLCATC